jgi:SAM-dependent methyltransferase
MSRGILRRIGAAIQKRGVVPALAAGTAELLDRVTNSYAYCRVFHSRRTFDFQGKHYRYVQRRYHSAWRSERVVEVPIVWDVVREYEGRKVLEVGNVLCHYYPVTHDRIDKYERAPGVWNEDIVDFRSQKRYDLIVSISTLEHVGWDEDPRDPDKIHQAMAALKRLSADGGRIVVTLPMAYNPELDARLRDGRIPFSRRSCLRRVSRDNRWREVEWRDIEDARFDAPFRRINGLVVLELGSLP